jgi:hypothetical protein
MIKSGAANENDSHLRFPGLDFAKLANSNIPGQKKPAFGGL